MIRIDPKLPIPPPADTSDPWAKLMAPDTFGDRLLRRLNELFYKLSPGLANTPPGGAPVDATYVTMTSNATLTQERVLTAGSGITITDGGANSTVTIASTATGGDTMSAVAAEALTAGQFVALFDS